MKNNKTEFYYLIYIYNIFNYNIYYIIIMYNLHNAK